MQKPEQETVNEIKFEFNKYICNLRINFQLGYENI